MTQQGAKVPPLGQGNRYDKVSSKNPASAGFCLQQLRNRT